MSFLFGLMGVASAEAPRVAVVIVDRQAREAGYALQIDGFVVDDALPVAVNGDEVLELLVPDGDEEPLDVAPGEAWEITGPDGHAWMSLLGEDVRTDRIVVRGPDEAVAALAVALDAKVVREGDRTWLAGEGVLLAAARVDEPARSATAEIELDEVGLVAGSDTSAPRERVATTPIPARGPVMPRASMPAVATIAEQPVPAVAAVAAVPGVAELPEVVAPIPAAAPVRTPADDARELQDERLREQYAGTWLCAGRPVWLHASGVYRGAGSKGTWRVSAPGVVRLDDGDAATELRAAIRLQDRVCRAVWDANSP